MDNGLVPIVVSFLSLMVKNSLNPCCSGQWSRTHIRVVPPCASLRLNPCCSGQWSRTDEEGNYSEGEVNVLILVVVDNGLVRLEEMKAACNGAVLILVVVDNGLVPTISVGKNGDVKS